MTSTEAAGRQPLPIELHAATRIEHTNLNRTIMTRLPLCLPNATSEPTLYTYGMTAFSQIYYGIEEAWDTLLSRSDINEEQRTLLSKTNFSQLRRKTRLDTSLACLRTKLDHPSQTQLSHLQSATLHFRQEITNAIISRPHLLLAYTWTMYLALFNGGRYMAKLFLSAGPAFWQEEDRAALIQGPLAFWFFGDDETYDGEDLKLAFKEAFNQVSEELDDTQRNEVIAESKKIFGMCAEMIEFLDRHVQAQPSAQAGRERQSIAVPSTPPAVLASETSISQPEPSLGYLSAFTPTSIANLWRSIATLLPSSQSTLPIVVRQEIDQKHG